MEKIIQKHGHERILESIKNGKNRDNISKDLFGYSNGKTTKFIKEYIDEFKVDTSHFDKQWKHRRHPKVIRKVCPQCGKEFETSGRDNNDTCSHKCSNIYFAKKRTVKGYKNSICSDCGKDHLIKKQASTKNSICDECKSKHRNNNIYHYHKSLKYRCSECGKKIPKTKYGLCKDCLPKSEEHRKVLSRAMRKRVKEGKHKGWATRTKLKPSYPEQYFIKLFENEGISYKRERKIDKYFADFVLDNNMVLEVDGKQHRRRKESDTKKDEVLTGKGYTVFRIEWYRPTGTNGRKKLYRQIKEFYNIIGHVSDTEKYKEVMEV